MVGHVESLEGKYKVMVTVGARIVSGDVDVGVLALKERSSGYFSPYT